MIRVFLTAVLMLLVSLPNGLCCCHVFEDEHAETDSHESPADEPIDDDHDCPCCQLKPALACDAGQKLIDGNAEFLLTLEGGSLTWSDGVSMHQPHVSSKFPPLARFPSLHCALRI